MEQMLLLRFILIQFTHAKKKSSFYKFVHAKNVAFAKVDPT